MKQEKALRRKKRQLKKANFLSNAKAILGFRKRQFDGLPEPSGSPFEPKRGYTPDIDPTKSNHRRVVERRAVSGRLGPKRNRSIEGYGKE